MSSYANFSFQHTTWNIFTVQTLLQSSSAGRSQTNKHDNLKLWFTSLLSLSSCESHLEFKCSTISNKLFLSRVSRSQYIQSIMHEKGRGSHHAVGDKTVHWRITVHVRKKAKGAVKLKCWELQDYYSHTHMHTEQWRDASCASTPVGNIECLKVWSRKQAPERLIYIERGVWLSRELLQTQKTLWDQRDLLQVESA